MTTKSSINQGLKIVSACFSQAEQDNGNILIRFEYGIGLKLALVGASTFVEVKCKYDCKSDSPWLSVDFASLKKGISSIEGSFTIEQEGDNLIIKSTRSKFLIPCFEELEVSPGNEECEKFNTFTTNDLLESMRPVSLFCKEDSPYETMRGIFFQDEYTLVANPSRIVFYEKNPFGINIFCYSVLAKVLAVLDGVLEIGFSKNFVHLRSESFKIIMPINNTIKKPIDSTKLKEFLPEISFPIDDSSVIELHKMLPNIKSGGKDVVRDKVNIHGRVGAGVIIEGQYGKVGSNYAFEISDTCEKDFSIMVDIGNFNTAISALADAVFGKGETENCEIGFSISGKVPSAAIVLGKLKQIIAAEYVI